MPTSPVIAKLSKLQDQVLETVEQVQEPVLSVARKAIDVVEPRLPEVPGLPLASKLPSVEELLSNQYDFLIKVLEQQKRFIDALLDASRSVTEKVVAQADEAPTKSASKKAA